MTNHENPDINARRKIEGEGSQGEDPRGKKIRTLDEDLQKTSNAIRKLEEVIYQNSASNTAEAKSVISKCQDKARKLRQKRDDLTSEKQSLLHEIAQKKLTDFQIEKLGGTGFNASLPVASSASLSTSRIVGISLEDMQLLLQKLQRFQETIGGDWKSVLNEWQSLQDCWRDHQYDRFEPHFEELCRTYEACKQQSENYIQFLQERIRASEEAAALLNL